MKKSPLAGKIAVVTGARRGIGRAIARRLADAGADIALCDAVVEDGKLLDTEKFVRNSGARAIAIQTDVTLQPEIEKLTRTTIDAFGKIDILVNCAGIWKPGQTLIECSVENWDLVINTNLKGTFLCCRNIGREMITRQSGCIINISSQVGLTPGAGAGAYPVSKAGIIMLTQQLALEMAPYSVRVNALAPGIVKTDFNASFWKESEKEKQASSQVPLGRLAEVEDIAESALFLASDTAGYITGEVLCVNGGWKPAAAVGKL